MDVPYYHKRIDGFAANKLLRDTGENGRFLVRDSDLVTGKYILAV